MILSEEDRLALLRQACPELKQAEADAALAQISAAKAVPGDGPRLKSGSDMPNPLNRIDEGADQPASAGFSYQAAISIADIPARYDAALRASDAVDFDDLILLPIRLLEEYPDVLAATQARYRWISVDEYQDVNAAQYRLLRLLTATGSDNLPRRHGEHGDDSINLCVIGDPDQAIYGFRGADRRYFLQFEQDYPGAVTLNLSRNYRSSQRILDAASQVIARNPDRKSVEILAEFADEVKLDVYRAPTDKAEAEYVVHQIEQMVGGISHFSLDSARVTGEAPAAAHSFADFAVLYRLSALLVRWWRRSTAPASRIRRSGRRRWPVIRRCARCWRICGCSITLTPRRTKGRLSTCLTLRPFSSRSWSRRAAPVRRLRV